MMEKMDDLEEIQVFPPATLKSIVYLFLQMSDHVQNEKEQLNILALHL